MTSFPKHFFGAVEDIPKIRRQEVLKNVKTRKQNYARDTYFGEVISQPKFYGMKEKFTIETGNVELLPLGAEHYFTKTSIHMAIRTKLKPLNSVVGG